MRLAWKLIVALLLGLIAVLALSGWLRVREEIKVFENDMRRDHEVVSHMLEPSLQPAWRAGGEPAVAREVGRRATVGRLSLRWLPPTAAASADDPDRRVERVSAAGGRARGRGGADLRAPGSGAGVHPRHPAAHGADHAGAGGDGRRRGHGADLRADRPPGAAAAGQDQAHRQRRSDRGAGAARSRTRSANWPGTSIRCAATWPTPASAPRTRAGPGSRRWSSCATPTGWPRWGRSPRASPTRWAPRWAWCWRAPV